MTTFERWSLIAGFAAIAVNVVAFVAVVWQLRLLAHQNRQAQEAVVQDHDRRRKQSTIEFFNATHSQQLEFRKILPRSRDSAEIATLIKEAIDGDRQAENTITGYLNLFENFAAGARAGVFDLAVINQMAGGRIIAIQRNYRPWVDHVRKQLGEPHLHAELEWLAGRMLDLRRSVGLSAEPASDDPDEPRA
jgi:hypothetical protein